MRTLIKIIIAVLIIGAVMYYEQFFSFFGLIACGIMILASCILPDSVKDVLDDVLDDELNIYKLVIGFCLFMIPWINIDIGLRVIHEDNQLKVVTAFYPFGKSLGNGYEIDTLKNIACCYVYDKEYYVEYEDMFVLKGDKYNSLFSRCAFIAHGTDLKFQKKDFGHGKLQICSYTDTMGVRHEIDMYGKCIQDPQYYPRLIDKTPDYTSTSY